MAEAANNKATSSDKIKLLLAALVFAGGLFGYYWFTDLGFIYRFLMAVGGTVVGLAIASTTSQGHRLSGFFRDVRGELRRVVWPTRQETMQTTVIVLVLVVIVGIFLWLLDMFFGFAFKSIVELGR